MKSLFTSLVLCFCAHFSLGQIAFQDALTLEKYVAGNGKFAGLPGDPNGYIRILRNYVEGEEALTDQQVKNQLHADNPFLAPLITTGGLSAELDKSEKITSASVLGYFGNLNAATFADGTAKFLIERAKEELNVAFFENLKEKFKIYPEFKILFPNTFNLLTSFESWSYANVLNTLREALDKDLKAVLQNIPKLANLSDASCNDSNDCKKRVAALKEFFATRQGSIFLSAVLLGNGFISGQKLPDVLHELAGSNYLGNGFDSNVTNSIALLDIISYSLKNNEYGKNYVSRADFTLLWNNNVTRNIYVGLVYQQIVNKKIRINGLDVFGASFFSSKQDELENYIEQFLIKGDQLTSSFAALANARNNPDTDLAPYFAAIFESGNSFLHTVNDLQKIDPRFTFNATLREVIDYTQKTLEIGHDISVKNYSAAVVGILSMMSEKLPPSQFSKEFVKYGSFAANMVQSRNSDDVSEAIRAVALPSGSASIKKKTVLNIALNAYLGAFYGNEYLADKPTGNWKGLSGVYTPIGITVSHGIRLKKEPKGIGKVFHEASVSLLVNLLDIGAFTAYRLKDSTTASLPEVKLQNLFAPGVGIVYGFPKWPLSIGYTYQLGPALREITSVAAQTNGINYRWQFFLAVDIPVFNFYSKSRK